MDLQQLDPEDRDYAIRTVLGEAANQGPVGQAAVAHVIRKRVEEGYGDNVRDVVLAPAQFTPWTKRSKELLSIPADSSAYQAAGQIVDGVFGGKIGDPTKGATHFAQVESSDPVNRNGWIRDMIARGGAVKIGAHTFGRSEAGKPKAAGGGVPGDLELVSTPGSAAAPEDLELVSTPEAAGKPQDGRFGSTSQDAGFAGEGPGASNLGPLRAGLERMAADQRHRELLGPKSALDAPLAGYMRAGNAFALNLPRNAAAGVATLAGKIGVPGYQDRGFDAYYARAKAQEEALADENPVSAGIGTGVGMVGGAYLLPALQAPARVVDGVRVAAPMLAHLWRGAATAGAYGAASEFADSKDPTKTAIAGGAGTLLGAALTPVGMKLGNVVGSIMDRFRTQPSAIVTPQGTLTDDALRAIREVGVDPGQVTPQLIQDLHELAATKGANAATVREAIAARWGIDLSEGQATQSAARQQFERTAAAGGHGEGPREVMRPFFDQQTEQVAAAKDAFGRELAGPVGQVEDPLVAASAVTDGVRSAAARGRAEYKGLYDTAFGHDGRFEPGTFDQVSGQISQRLEGRADPVFIDPDLTPAAAKALASLEQIPNLKLAGTPPQKVTVLPGGSSPASAPAAGASMPAAGPAPAAPGAAAAAPKVEATFTPAGRKVETEFRLVDAGELKTSHLDDFTQNPAYPQELQPRDRGRAASEAQVVRMARELEPQRLGASPSTADGAPIVGADGLVESGNGRVMAIRRAYAEGGDAANRYRSWLQSQGYDVSGMQQPVLVRVRSGQVLAPEERVALAQESNASQALTMGASERAATDAKRLPDEALGLYQGGAVTDPANRDFVRAFVGSLSKGEEGSVVTKGGELSIEGAKRLETALLHRAYDDGNLVSALAETGDDNIRAFGGLLQDLAPDVAKLKAGIAGGTIAPGADLSKPLLEAAQLVQAARSKGLKLPEAVAQQDAFQKLSPEADAVLRTVYGADLTGRVNRSRAGEALRSAVADAGQQAPEAGLFGGPLSAADILAARAAKPTADPAAAGAAAPTPRGTGTPDDPIRMTAAEFKAAQEAGTLPGQAPAAAPGINGSANTLTPAKSASAPATTTQSGPLDLKGVDQARRKLVAYYKHAKGSGNATDARAVSGVIEEFDASVERAMSDGLFSGSDDALKALRSARSAFSSYQRTFRPNGAGDDVGTAMRRIIERDAQPQEVANMLFGQAQVGAKGSSVRIAERLRNVLGDDSAEWGAIRQGLWQRLTTRPEGVEDFGVQALSQRIGHFLSGDGRELARAIYSPEELRAIGEFGQVVRTLRPLKDTVNSSGSGYTVLAALKGKLSSKSLQILGSIGGFALDGGITSTITGYGIGKLLERAGAGVKARGLTREAQRAASGAPLQPRESRTFGAPGIGLGVADLLP